MNKADLRAAVTDGEAMTVLKWLHYRRSLALEAVTSWRSIAPSSAFPYDAVAARDLQDLVRRSGASLLAATLERLARLKLVQRVGPGAYALTKRGLQLSYNAIEYDIQVVAGQLCTAAQHLEVQPGEVLLDVGSAAGATLGAIQRDRPGLAVGLDLSYLDLWMTRPLWEGYRLGPLPPPQVQGDACRLPLIDASVDVVTCKGVLQFLPRRQFLCELARVLKPGGRLLLVTPHLDYPLAQLLRALHRGHVDLRSLFMLANGVLLHVAGRQQSLRGLAHHFETRSGLRGALAQAGLRPIHDGPLGTPFSYPGTFWLVAEKVA